MYNFITFRTYKSVDEYIKKLNSLDMDTKLKQYKIDIYLDCSNNGCYLYNKQITILKNVLYEHNNIDYELVAFAIMPNHVHLLLQPFKKLSEIMRHIKGKTAKKINESLNLNGKFWAREYYDKVIRNDKQFNITVEYILNNPTKANLKDANDRVYCKYFSD
jgi:REP element-mobilizing transposase RayT